MDTLLHSDCRWWFWHEAASSDFGTRLSSRINQNQSINQSINQSNNQTIKQSNNQAIKQSNNQSNKQPTNQTKKINQPHTQGSPTWKKCHSSINFWHFWVTFSHCPITRHSSIEVPKTTVVITQQCMEKTCFFVQPTFGSQDWTRISSEDIFFRPRNRVRDENCQTANCRSRRTYPKTPWRVYPVRWWGEDVSEKVTSQEWITWRNIQTKNNDPKTNKNDINQLLVGVFY